MVIESTEPYSGDLNCYFVPMDKFLQHFVWLDPEEGIDRPEFLHSDEIQRLISITTEKGLKKIFPDSKLVYSKLATCYYKVKDKHWIRCSYKMKDNKTYATQYSQMHTDNIDFDRFIVEKIYTGDEKENRFNDLWNRKPFPKVNDGIYKPVNV